MFNNFIGKHQDNHLQEVEMSVTIYAGASLDGKRIMDYDWPANSIVTSVYRGEQRIIPNGQTKLAAGDTLIIQVCQSRTGKVLGQISRAAHYADV